METLKDIKSISRKIKQRRKKLSKTTRIAVYNKYNGHCAYCGRTITTANLVVDHFKPLCKGGTNEISNFMPSCQICNQTKDNLSLKKFRKKIRTALNGTVGLLQQANSTLVYYGLTVSNNWDNQFYFEKQKKH